MRRKQLFAVLMAGSMAASLAACGKTDTKKTTAATEKKTEAATEKKTEVATTEAKTEKATEKETEAATEKETEAATEAKTEEASSEEATEAKTEEASSEEATEADTEEASTQQGCPCYKYTLDITVIYSSWEWDYVADVAHSCQVHNAALKSQTKACMTCTSVLS